MKVKNIFLGVLICLFIFPNGFALAEADSQDVSSLQQQLIALQRYVQKITFALNPTMYTVSSDEVLRTSIQEGVAWLRESQEQSGHFAYEYVPYEERYLYGDNIVRQAGALYALSEVARRDTKGDPQTNKTIETAIEYFDTLSPEHTYENQKVRCLTKNEENNTCMLGATALALTGVLGYIEAQPEKTDAYKDLIEGYAQFILKSKIQNAGFRDEYRIGIGFKGVKESLFSNGESLLALVRYYQYKKSDDVKNIIDETFLYIEGNEFDASLYLWAMAAIKDMNELWPSEQYVSYGKDFTNWRLNLLTRSKGTNRNYCASTEGLVSAYSLLEDTNSDYEKMRLRSQIDFWNTKNLDFQIGKNDMYRFAYVDDLPTLLEVRDINQSRGGFLTADDELTQRIDFTQHCISTYLQTLVDVDRKTL